MQALPLFQWGVVVLALAGLGLPLAARLFPTPRLAAGAALPLALAVAGLVAYWVGHVTFGPVALLAALLAPLALAALAGRRDALAPSRAYAGPAVVFALAFALLLAVRLADPAVFPWGGEKFLDFGLLRAVVDAPRLPPEDLWFAGKPVRYYYGSQVLGALLARLARVAPERAYNLLIPTWYAALAALAYALAGTVAERAGRSPRVAGVAATLFVAVGGTLATPARALLSFVPRDLAATYGRALVVGVRMPFPEALDAVRFLADGAGYQYWWARHVVPHVASVFPLWAFLNGDLRPHMVSAPFLLLAAALSLSLARATDPRRRRALLGALAGVGGLLALVNTWTLPTVAGLAALAVALGPGDPAALLWLRTRRPALSGLPEELFRYLIAGVAAGCVALVSAALAAPFLLFHMPVSRGLIFFPPRTPLSGVVLVWGAFLVPFAVALALLAWPRARDVLDGRYAALLGAGALVVGALLVTADLAVLALVGPVLVAAWWAARRRGDRYDLLLVVAGAGVLLVVEFVAPRVWPFDPDAPRWNTTYKVFWQVWLLWGVAAGAAVARVVGRLRDAWPAREGRRAVPVARVGAAALVVCALVGSASFGAFALTAHFDDPDEHPGPSGTLDATAFVDSWRPDAAAAIDWLDARPGHPTLLAKPGQYIYQWRNGPSSLTGLPTVVGWNHEKGYRGRDAYVRRVRDVALVYTTPDERTRRSVLDQYGVDYVYVGAPEREAYGADVNETLAASPVLEPAFTSGEVTVYRVRN